MKGIYDRDYFERGIESGKSCYQNYRWIPELTIPMAMTIIDYLEIKPYHKILDFGCAKGFLVKAFRWLNRKSWGVDISEYAIPNCDPEVEEFCHFAPVQFGDFDFIIAKDVFEHMRLEDIREFFEMFKKSEPTIFAVIPLGVSGRFIAPANNMDTSHITCLDAEGWGEFFMAEGMIISNFTFCIEGIKDSYYDKYPLAHGFFTLSYGENYGNRNKVS